MDLQDAWSAIDPPTITDTIKQTLDQDMHDLLADLTAQSYFVARELDTEHAIAFWADLTRAVVGSYDLEDLEELPACRCTESECTYVAV